MSVKTVTASEAGVLLDSNVYDGGGTDATAVLQAILDTAPQYGHLRIILDGAALITGLRVHSNTTIECPNSDCGFFLADGANRALITNADWNMYSIQNHDIALIGGTYNHNSSGQAHDRQYSDDWGGDKEAIRENMAIWGIPYVPYSETPTAIVMALEFYGVKRLTLRDITIRNQRTYSLCVQNWEQVTAENIRIDLPDRVHYQNQDGLHFFGPGRFLTLRNISGCAGDDFIALAPDEIDSKSSITDVLIDGVFLDDADQGIRLLSRGTGKLDRVTIRNVTGTYRSFGFFINPFFEQSPGGAYGNIVIENVDLRQNGIDYTYTNPFLFRVGGKIDSLVLRNITYYHPIDNRSILDIGQPGCPWETQIQSVLLDGLRVFENVPESTGAYISVENARVANLTVRNAEIFRASELPPIPAVCQFKEGAEVKNLVFRGITAENTECLVDAKSGHTDRALFRDVFFGDGQSAPFVKGTGISSIIE